MTIENELNQIFDDESFKLYQKEQLRFIEDWQYIESASTTDENRFKLDKEAYIKTFYKSVYYKIYRDYDDRELITKLALNIEYAKHPVWIQYRNFLLKKINDKEDEKIESKTDRFSKNIREYGFFELAKVKCLTVSSQTKLIDLLITNNLPYCIAMFDYLSFLNYLEKEHFITKNSLFIGISEWFECEKSGRTVKGNINSLSGHTNESKSRYTAYKHVGIVQENYKELE